MAGQLELGLERTKAGTRVAGLQVAVNDQALRSREFPVTSLQLAVTDSAQVVECSSGQVVQCPELGLELEPVPRCGWRSTVAG